MRTITIVLMLNIFFGDEGHAADGADDFLVGRLQVDFMKLLVRSTSRILSTKWKKQTIEMGKSLIFMSYCNCLL